MRAMSSALPTNSIVVTASAIISDARGPKMCTPSSRSVLASDRTLTMPSVSSIALARPLAANGNLPTRYSIPASFSCSSVLPTLATSGQI